MQNDLISIIIPVYNAQKYIKECMKSILAQSYGRFEVILVNDGSEDNSAEICGEFAALDSRVHVIHKENGGVSSARMMGLTNAIGEYVAFVDVDDLLDNRYLEVLYTDALEQNADIVCCDCIETESGYESKEISHFRMVLDSRKIVDVGSCYQDYFEHREFYGKTVWGKLIRRSLALSEPFESIKYGEDTEYMLKLFSHNPSIYLDQYRGYYYIRWDQSATKKTHEAEPLRMRDGVVVAHRLLENCQMIQNKSLIKQAENYFARCLYGTLSAFVKNGKYTVYHSCREDMEQYVTGALRGKTILRKYRAALELYRFSDRLYWMIFSVLLRMKSLTAGK